MTARPRRHWARATVFAFAGFTACRALWSCSDGAQPGDEPAKGTGGSKTETGGATAETGGAAGASTGGGESGGAQATGGGAGKPGSGGAKMVRDASASSEDDECRDPGRKRCGGFCVTPRAEIGCTLTGCEPCPKSPFARAVCNGEKCGLECDDGTAPTASGCTPAEGGITATCSDGLRDGAETDVDCGGPCPPCALGKGCAVANDCENMQCDAATKKCDCTRLTCADVTGTCGTLSDGCGGQITCAGTCGTGSVCFNGRCCTRRTTAECGAGACGAMDDGCGGTVDCGMCTAPDVCGLVVVNQCSHSGTGCGTDTDFDGLDDCAEDADGDPWTDKTVFNGVSARLSDACSTLFNDCSRVRIGTASQADSCIDSKSAIETRNEFSGWDFTTTDTQSCDAGYGYRPTWTTCRSRFAVEGSARMNVKADGTYCFAIDGETQGQCAAFFFDGESSALQSKDAARCYPITAGEHTVRYLYTVGSGAGNRRFRLLFCQGAACTPTAALPSSMLRVP
jgi:hypothetical protein